MENYILKTAFILTLINIVSPELNFAHDTQILFRHIKCDTSKLKKRVFSTELKPNGSVKVKLNTDELDSLSGFLVTQTDTGKYFHRFFFKDGSGINRKFVDSLILGFPKDSVLQRFRFREESILENRRRLYPDYEDNSIEIPNMLRKGFPEMHIDRFNLPDRMIVPQKNSQSFSFRNTDNDGRTLHIRA